jgi:hypothetical protein
MPKIVMLMDLISADAKAASSRNDAKKANGLLI